MNCSHEVRGVHVLLAAAALALCLAIAALVSASYAEASQASVVLLDSEGNVVYDQSLLPTGATSSISEYELSSISSSEKPSYRLELSYSASLLDNGSDEAYSSWLLLSCASDPTFLRNQLALDLACELGISTAVYEAVEMYLDGSYCGCYLLVPSYEALVEGGEGANAAQDASSNASPTASKATATNSYGYAYQYVVGAADEDPQDVTFLVQQVDTLSASYTCWFRTRQSCFVVMSPSACSQSAMLYISEYFQAALDNAEAGMFNLQDGCSFDLDSLVGTYALTDFLKNVDAFSSAAYFSKVAGDAAICTLPLYNYDSAMGLRNDYYLPAQLYSYQGWNITSTSFWANNATVQDALRTLYTDTLASLVRDVLLGDEDAVGSKGALHSLSWHSTRTAALQSKNAQLYGYETLSNEIDAYSTYEQNCTYLCEWLSYRLAWYDDNITTYAGTIENATTFYNGVDYALVYDYSYYLLCNPDVLASVGTDPYAVLEHFVTSGMSVGRTSSRSFSVSYYKDAYTDLQAAFGDDLTSYYYHYIDYGFSEGRSSVEEDALDNTIQFVFRLYNPASSEHLYTTNMNETFTLATLHGWAYEGIAWDAPHASSAPVYRLYNAALGDHYYTTNAYEISVLENSYGWVSEGPTFYSLSADDEGAQDASMLYNAALASGQHHYTLSANEADTLVAGYGWEAQGVAWCCYETKVEVYVAPVVEDSVVEAYISWALDIAADDSHGYSQANRWGPDYDCSSLVISALEAAGLEVGSATYTGNMRSELEKYGWTWITDLSQLQRGDILLNEVHHTAIYLGDGLIVAARSSETGGIVGQEGDQTGNEICVHDYYDYPWDGFLRYTGT